MVVAELSIDKLNNVRTEMPIDNHKRHDLYAVTVCGEVKVPNCDFDQSKIQFGQHQVSGKCVPLQSRYSILTPKSCIFLALDRIQSCI